MNWISSKTYLTRRRKGTIPLLFGKFIKSIKLSAKWGGKRKGKVLVQKANIDSPQKVRAIITNNELGTNKVKSRQSGFYENRPSFWLQFKAVKWWISSFLTNLELYSNFHVSISSGNMKIQFLMSIATHTQKRGCA